MQIPIERFLNSSREGFSKPMLTPLILQLKNQEENINKTIKALSPKI